MQLLEPFELTDAASAARYAGLTYPAFRALLEKLGADPSVVAFAVESLGRPAGLVLAERRSKGGGDAVIRSIYVTPELRGRGIATALLERIETALRQRGYDRATLVYPAGKPTTPALEAVLRKRDWAEPFPSMFLGECDITAVPFAAEHALVPLPEPFRVMPWTEITAQEIDAVAASHQANPWIPSTLLPWEWGDGAEPRTSLGLRHGSDLVGWMLTHRIDDLSLRYSSGWVREELQRVGRAQPFLHLIAESTRRATASGYQRAVWYVSPTHQRMIAVSIRRGLRSAATFRETMRSAKELAPSGSHARRTAGGTVAAGAQRAI